MKIRDLYSGKTAVSVPGFAPLISDLAGDSRAARMRLFTQHGAVSTYAHCMAVALLSYLLVKKLSLRVNERQLVRAAFLHDYFLYDWHTHGDRLHGFHHPATAACLAERDFSISDKEADIIRSHMWPLNLTQPPRSREAVIVNAADKICSAYETLEMRRPKTEHRT